jgi:integrase
MAHRSGRRASVRYWQSRKAYCCWFQGVQQVLATGPDDFPDGPTYQEALKAFSALTSLASADMAGDKNTCRVVSEKYMRHIENRLAPNSVKLRQKYLKQFCDALGDVMAKDLTHQKVYSWLDEWRCWRKHPSTGLQTRWTDGSVRNACTSISAAYNWAVKAGLITRNPLKGLEMPAPRSRGRYALLGDTPAEREEAHRKIVDACTPALREVVVLLHATGCRPGEAINATAKDFDSKIGAIVYHADDKRLADEFRHKTAGKGKDRVIILSGDALEMVKGLVKMRPRGQLFRTSKGRRLHKHLERSGWSLHTLEAQFVEIRKRIGMPKLTPYSYRHTFATGWLEQGRSVEILAELMGNSPAVIRKHYSHLLSDKDNLRRQMEAYRSTQAERTESGPVSYAG